MMYLLPESGMRLPCWFVGMSSLTLVEIRLPEGLRLHGNFFFGDTTAKKRDEITAFIRDVLEDSSTAGQLSLAVRDVKLIEAMLAGKPDEMILERCHLFMGDENTLHGTLLHAGFITEKGSQG